MRDDDERPDEQDGGTPPSEPSDSAPDHEQTVVFDSTGTSRPPASRDPGDSWVGQTVGRYEITELLGAGGMGVVYKAHDSTIERDVAIKVLSQHLGDDKSALQRFLAEAKAVGQLNHPNIVTLHEVAQTNDSHYLVMEYVSGGSTAERAERGEPFSVVAATTIASQACQGLAAAHKRGLIHRDIKPANLLLAEDGRTKIADFGLAKREAAETTKLTQAGQVVGTPHYMSPEQCESRTVDHRTDIYSLGATFFSLLTGKDPYGDAGSAVQVMFAHCHADIPDPRNETPQVPEACAQIIHRAMAKKPEDRYQSIEEMQRDLDAVLASLSGAGIALPSQSAPHPAIAPGSGARSGAYSGTTTMIGRLTQVRWRIWAALGIVAALGIGFGLFVWLSDDAGSTAPVAAQRVEPGATTAPVAMLPTGEPIKVGVLHSMTGTMGNSESPVVDATLLALDELNQAGGLLGRPVEPIVRDGRSRDGEFATQARQLITEEEVVTVFGCWTSSSRKTVVPIFEEHDHLLIYPVQYEGLEISANVVYMGAAPNQQIIPAVRWAFAFGGARRFFLVGSDYVFPRAANAIIKDTLDELGAELVGERYLPLGAVKVSSVIEAIADSGADVILNTINGDTNVAFFHELRAAGISPDDVTTISFSIGEAELQHLDLSKMVGDLAAWNYFQSIDTPENRDFVKRFRARFGPQRVITDPMESAYIGVKLWAQAVENAGSVETRAIRDAMDDQSLLGPHGEVRIDDETRHTYKTPRLGRITADGQFEVVWTEIKPEAPVPYPPSRKPQEWKAFLSDLKRQWGGQWAAPTP